MTNKTVTFYQKRTRPSKLSVFIPVQSCISLWTEEKLFRNLLIIFRNRGTVQFVIAFWYQSAS